MPGLPNCVFVVGVSPVAPGTAEAVEMGGLDLGHSLEIGAYR